MLKYECKNTLASPTVRETTPLEKTKRSENPLGAKGNIGFVGLGRMGTAMAANLASSGRHVTAYIRHQDQIDRIKDLSIEPTTDFTRLFKCKVVISMVSDDDAAREIVFGRSDIGLVGLAKGLTPDAIHLSMSTISTATASQLASEHARYGQGYVAAPVLGIRLLPRHASCSLSLPVHRPMSKSAVSYSRRSGNRPS